MKKSVIAGITLAFLIGMVGAATAEIGPNTEVFPHMTAEFEWVQTYSGWGPALYYGETVTIRHEAINQWTLNRQDLGDGTYKVRQFLTQKGTAYVYDSGDNLIDTQLFSVNEKTIGTVDYVASWYHVYSFSSVDVWDYHWRVGGGIYHYWGRAKDSQYQFDYWIRRTGWVHLYP